MRTEPNAPVCTTDPDLWFSESVNDRRTAQALCLSCPLMVECREYGEGQENGVWGGVDRTVRGESARKLEQARKREEKQERNTKIVTLYRDGHTMQEIGRRLGISHVTASSVISNAA